MIYRNGHVSSLNHWSTRKARCIACQDHTEMCTSPVPADPQGTSWPACVVKNRISSASVFWGCITISIWYVIDWVLLFMLVSYIIRRRLRNLGPGRRIESACRLSAAISHGNNRSHRRFAVGMLRSLQLFDAPPALNSTQPTFRVPVAWQSSHHSSQAYYCRSM